VNNHYNKKLKPFSRGLRSHSTKAEVRMWCELLRNKTMMGFPFLRQRPISRYIADFFCKELKLIIELDGITHSHEEVAQKDEQKQSDLEALGYTVLRFTDNDVMERISIVSDTIQHWVVTNHADKLKDGLFIGFNPSSPGKKR
jgi:very-short-patch-repair endonuclease